MTDTALAASIANALEALANELYELLGRIEKLEAQHGSTVLSTGEQGMSDWDRINHRIQAERTPHEEGLLRQLAEKDKEIERLTEYLKIRTSECRNLEAKINSEVLAEREDCAKIAQTTEREGFGGGAYNEAGRDIAAAIRNQKP